MSFFRIICAIVIGYAFGLFQTAYFYGKARGVDIRKVGSGNAGTTNALRNFGTKAGAIVFAGDFLKCVAAILVVRLLMAHGSIGAGRVLGLAAGLGCVLGHNFPFYLSFKGGKGIACSFAVIFLFSAPVGLSALAVFIAVFTITHYVSAGSLVSTGFAYAMTVFGGALKLFHLTPSQYRWTVILLTAIVALAFWQHRSNIGRLMNHCENKTYLFRKK